MDRQYLSDSTFSSGFDSSSREGSSSSSSKETGNQPVSNHELDRNLESSSDEDIGSGKYELNRSFHYSPVLLNVIIIVIITFLVIIT
jgi:hypothetical protein